MSNTNKKVKTVPCFDSHKDVIVKWVQVLYICQVASLFTTAFGAIGAIGSSVEWISRIITIIITVSLFSLSAVNERYRKAALFYGISVVGGILSAFLNKDLNKDILGLVISICSIIASYQQLNAHSEITAPKNAKLSKNWHSLFYYELVVGLISAFITLAVAVMAVLAEADPYAIMSFVLIILVFLSVILNLFHVMYLKQTLSLYKE
ncbi:MAG: hypothetical protein IJB65_08140 [Clostridia bacterium]|nr:hypothetical protein [Clostridia bacterium]